MTPVYLCKLPDGPIVVLEGIAGLIYRVLASDPADDWVGEVARAVGEDPATVAHQLEAFVGDLTSRGLLV